MILVKVEDIFRATGSQALREEANLTSEAREMAHIWEKEWKHRIANRYNADVIPKKFQEGDLVLQRANFGLPPPDQGTLMANYEGPYKVIEVLGKGDYKLSTLLGSEVLRSWNSLNFRKFFIWWYKPC